MSTIQQKINNHKNSMFNSRKIEELERQVALLDGDNRRIRERMGAYEEEFLDHKKKIWETFRALCKYLNVEYVDEPSCRKFVREFDTITTDLENHTTAMPNEKLEAIGKEIGEVSKRLIDLRVKEQNFRVLYPKSPQTFSFYQRDIDIQIDLLLKLLKTRDEIAKT